MAVAKIDPKVIFASEAPVQDTPAVFTNKTVGWGESRKSGGRPTIKQSNALQQETDLKILWLNENSVTPFDATIDYPENAVTIKDGVFKILESGVWELFLDKSSVGLGNVDNTSDLNKPVSTAVQTALNLKADKSTTYTKSEVNNALDLLKPPYLSSDVVDGNQTQDQINLFGGKKYDIPVGGYPLNARVLLDNGDIVKSTIPNNSNDPNVNMTGWRFDDNTVESIADMLAIANPKKGMSVFVNAYYVEQYGGHGKFTATQKSGLVSNGGTIFASTNPLIFWVRQDQSELTPEDFGATDAAAHTAIQKMLDLGFPVNLNDKTYLLNYPLVLNTNSVIKGKGTDKSRLRKITTNTVTGFDMSRTVEFPVIGGGGATYSIDVDAILVTAPKDYSANYNYYTQLEDFTCDRLLPDDGTNYMTHHNADFQDTGYGKYGWYFPYLCQSVFKNTRCFNNEYGIYTINTWMNTFERVQWRASKGVVFGGLTGDVNRGGTSTNLTDCWVTDVMGGVGQWAWQVTNLDYSNWSSCATDFIGREGETPADGVIRLESLSTGANLTMSINGFASEVVHAKQYMYAKGRLTLNGTAWTALDWFNKYGGQSNYLFESDETAQVKLSHSNLKFMHDYDNPSVAYYNDMPKFMRANWGSTLEIADSYVYPKVSGRNDVGRFAIQAMNSSTARFKSRTSELISVSGTSDDSLVSNNLNLFITNQGIQSDSTTMDSGMVSPTACRWNTNQLRLGDQYIWYSPTYDKWLYSSVKPTSETSGTVLGSDTLTGITAQRPTAYPLRLVGGAYFDTTLNKPVWWNGVNWVDSLGTVS